MYAARVNGKYVMYWGENDVNIAFSDDCVHWVPVLAHDNGSRSRYQGRPDQKPVEGAKPLAVFSPRRTM